ncbi:hypothetical protein O181_028097 [Austropuccinia psidii MF-1]|uniref:Uncharacterized protein n=1 Tax=Austropuccinia psidii MF-1 TaxID=1389203 RepID=A0A9Q3H2A1_9BASI|nr:hypothetical protein [Austropuccinia psidii MF-1]
MASMARGPYAVACGLGDSYALFGPIPMRPRGQLSSVKPQVGPPEPFFDPKPTHRKWPKNHLRSQICQEPQVGHKSVLGLWKPSEATRAAPRKDSPPVQGKTSPSSMHSVLKDQEWCIYGIIYHYAPFLLSNPMVELSYPNY